MRSVDWEKIEPNDNYDWINQIDDSFEKYTPLYDKGEESIFKEYSPGAKQIGRAHV